MKLKRIINNDNLQGYSIKNPSSKFKSMYPNKYIFVINSNGNVVIDNVNSIPIIFAMQKIIGYIFTYADSFPDFMNCNSVKYTDVGNTFPSCLDEYFIKNDDKVDLILSCKGNNNEVPLQFIKTIVIRCNSEEFMKNNLKTSILKIANNVLEDNKIDNVEDWLKNIINDAPFNNNEFPYKYGKTISNKKLKEKSKLTKDNIFIEYDLRAKSYEHENNFICELENEFETKDTKITLFNTYNDILSEVRKQLDEKKLKYDVLDANSISVNIKYLRKLDIEFQLNDFI